MGMFQPQNYGADFIGAMSATTGMLDNQRRTDLAAKEMEQREKRLAAEDQTRTLTNQGLTLENQKKAAELDREKLLQDFLPRADALLKGQLDTKEQAALAGTTEELMKLVPYAPSRVEEIPDYRKKLGTLIQGVESIRSLPPSNYVYSRADGVSEINNLLDNYQGVLSQERLGKTFTDPDGSITGKAGGEYTTTAVGGFMMASGEGNKAGFVPLFSVAGADGKPLMKQDGRPVLVPATEGATNGPQDKLRVVTPEELLTKAGFAYKLMDVADTLGLSDPEKRKAYVSGKLNSYRGEDGAKALAESLKPKERKVKSVDPAHNLVDEETGEVLLAGTPKPKEDKAPTRSEFERDGYKVTEEYQGDGKWKVVARSKIKDTGGSGGGGSEGGMKGTAAGGKRSIKEIVDEYQAMKTKRNDQFAKDTEELRKVNSDRAVQQEPPLTMEQYFKGKESPAHKALTQNMYQLRDVAKNSYGYDLINMKPMEQGAPAKGMAAPAQKPAPKKTQLAKNDTRPPLSAFMKRKP